MAVFHTEVRPEAQLDWAALQSFLQTTWPHQGALMAVKQFSGGFSNWTYRLQLELGVAVLRLAPAGAAVKNGHDMVREYHILQALKGAGFDKAPRPLAVETTGAVLGRPFYIMSALEGLILRTDGQSPPTLPAATMADLSTQIIDNLAFIHNIDIDAYNLRPIGKPEGYVERQVSGWFKRYETAATDDLPLMDSVGQWLQTQRPRPQTPTLLHNDYKFDNVVWTKEATALLGILDWEMATVGDPLMDLGAALAWWCEPSDPPFTRLMNVTWWPGALSKKEALAHYAQKTGRDVSDINFYYVFGLYKNAVIAQQIYARWQQGLSKDPRFAALGKGVQILAQMAAEAVSRGAF